MIGFKMNMLYYSVPSDEGKSTEWLLGEVSLLLRRGAHKGMSVTPVPFFFEMVSSLHLMTPRTRAAITSLPLSVLVKDRVRQQGGNKGSLDS